VQATPHEAATDLTELLIAAGWGARGGGPVHPYAPSRGARDALEVLDVDGAWDDSDRRTPR
jgi:hypothetical protein